jgi:heptosyltransferase-2
VEYANILIRATNWVGDAVMCLPALQVIRERYPKAHIAVLAKPWVADLYRRENFADEVIQYDRSRWAHFAPAEVRLRYSSSECL